MKKIPLIALTLSMVLAILITVPVQCQRLVRRPHLDPPLDSYAAPSTYGRELLPTRMEAHDF